MPFAPFHGDIQIDVGGVMGNNANQARPLQRRQLDWPVRRASAKST